MKILLLNPPFHPRYSREQRSPAVTKGGTLYYPFWLAFAAGVLEREKHQILLLDAPAEGIDVGETMARIDGFTPELAVVNTSTPSIYNDVGVAGMIKDRHPSSYTVLVGTHPSALPEATLNLNAGVEAVAIGEYDYTLRDLAACLQAGGSPSSVSGLVLREGSSTRNTGPRKYIEDLDSLPFLSEVYKKHLDVRNYYFAAADYPMVMIITGRGCPHRCFYCVYPQVFHGHRYRIRSPENIAAEFSYVAEQLPEVREIGIEDDTFTIDRTRVEKFCRLLIDRGNRLKWYCNVRADLDYELMALMKAAGCRLVTVGFESGEQAILDGMKKNLRAADYPRFARDAKRAGLLVHGCLIAGLPGETRETLEKSFRLAKELDCDSMQFYPLIVYPGTEAYHWAKENDYLLTEDYRQWLTPALAHNCVLDFPGLSREELEDFCERAYRRYHFNLRYMIKKLVQLFTHPAEGRRTIRSAAKYLRYLLRERVRPKR